MSLAGQQLSWSTLAAQCLERAVEPCRRRNGKYRIQMATAAIAVTLALEKDRPTFMGSGGVSWSQRVTCQLGIFRAQRTRCDPIDADCHASIYDGCRMSGAKSFVFQQTMSVISDSAETFRGSSCHGWSSLKESIAKWEIDDAGGSGGGKTGAGACLLVDEAHSLGVLGSGVADFRRRAIVESSVDFIVGTSAKPGSQRRILCLGSSRGGADPIWQPPVYFHRISLPGSGCVDQSRFKQAPKRA